jgi:Trypsin
VRAGTNNFTTGGTIHTIVEAEIHPDYVDSAYWPNDVAVLKVTPPFEWSSLLQPVVLADTGFSVENETPCVIAGWGALFVS